MFYGFHMPKSQPMDCCNERGLLRPLLSGSAASRNGNTSVRGINTGYRRNKRLRKSGASNSGSGVKGISHHQNNGYDGMTNEHNGEDDYDDEFGEEYEDRSCAYWWKVTVTMLRKIGLLVWKNLLLRRRHYVVTALEIILPTICAMLMVIIGEFFKLKS